MNPIVFSTTRCRVDLPTRKDAEAIRNLYLDTAVRRYLGGPATAKRAEAAVRAATGGDGDQGRTRAIRPLDEDHLIGLLFLGAHHDGVDIEVSYMISPPYWGRGFATEAVGGLLERARAELGLTRLVAETRAANVASCRVLERVGLQPVRRLVRFGAAQILHAIEL